MDILEKAEHEFEVYGKPTYNTSKSMVIEIESLRAQLKGSQEQQPVGFVYRSLKDCALHAGLDILGEDRVRHGDKLYASPIPAQQSPLITEQDAYEIILNFYWFMEAFKNKHGNNPSVIEWRDAEGRALLDKLNNQ